MDSIEAIEKDYQKRIKASEDEAEQRELRSEMREKVADFREAAAVKRELDAHRTAVIAEKNLGEWADMVTGSTPEEIDASATKIADRLKALQSDDAAARAAYGSPAAGGGNSAPPRETPIIEGIHDFEGKLNDATRGSRISTGTPGADALGVRDIQNYGEQLFAAQVLDAMARYGKTARMREAAGRIDPNTLQSKA